MDILINQHKPCSRAGGAKLAFTSPDRLWGGELEYLAGRDHSLEHGVVRLPSLFLSKSVWRKPVRHRRSIKAVRRFERNFVNLLLVGGSGAMTFRSSTHAVVVEAGSFFCTKADRAYHCDLVPGQDQPLEVLHMMVASRRMTGGLHKDNALHGPIRATGADWEAIRDSAELLFALGAEMTPGVSQALVDGLLAAISASTAGNADAPPTLTVMERRQAEILSFIDDNLEKQHLSAGIVASGCGISSRYLSRLLRQAGSSLPQIIRSRRVALAQSIMDAPDKQNLRLREIAEMAGFRSYAQFHLAFRKQTGMPPADFRKRRHSANSRSRSNVKPS